MSNTRACKKRFSELLKYKNKGGFFFSQHGLVSDGEFNGNVDASWRVVMEMKEYNKLTRAQREELREWVMDHKR